MDGVTQEHGSGSQKRLSIGFLVSLMALCARHASRVSKKLKAKPTRKQVHLEDFLSLKTAKLRGGGGYDWSPRHTPPRSPLRARPKELLTTLSNKAFTLVRRKKTADYGGSTAAEKEKEEEEYGVWQKAILMGDKCQPLDFSGVIYYDCDGRQLKEVPLRSPRASPLPGYLARGYAGSPLNPTGMNNIRN